MGTLYAGSSGWSYASWKPGFYPPKLASKNFLGHYASRLNSVEVNYTFRRFPSEKLLEGWIASTPEGFQFAVKAHQMITHIKRLRETGEWIKRFLSSLYPLEDARKLGPVLIQLPPFLSCDLPLLEDFLAEVPRSAKFAFEFRHDSWFSDNVYAILRKANVALCQAESEKIETPEIQTADFSYFRLRKESYSSESRKRLASKIKEQGKQGNVFVYFKHEETPEGALYAEELLEAVRRGK